MGLSIGLIIIAHFLGCAHAVPPKADLVTLAEADLSGFVAVTFHELNPS